MSASQVYVDTAALAAGGLVYNNLCIKGSQSSICLLYAAQATSNVLGQPATGTLNFVVPGSVATDLVVVTRMGVPATAGAALVANLSANPGLANATWTITCSTNEALTASIFVYRAV